MQIVIDIPDGYIKTVIANQRTKGTAMDKLLRQAVIDGIQLPKGHGKLIDADKLKPRDISPESWYSPIWGFELVDIEDAPTVVETDYAGLEEKHFGNPVDKTGIYADLSNKVEIDEMER